MNPKLHRKLRAARLSQRLTLRDVAEKSQGDLSHPFVSEVERGEIQEPSPQKLKAFAGVLGLDFLELMVLAGHITVKDLKGRV